MDYSNLIQSMKSSLDDYQKASEEELSALYSAAREEYNKSYTASLENLDRQYKSDVNDAYAKRALEDKNTGEYLASRGLSRSGESANAKIASGVTLGNTLDSLSESMYDSKSRLTSQYGQALAGLAEKEAAEKSENRKWYADLSASLASAAEDNRLKEEQLQLDRDKLQHTVEMDNNELKKLKEELEAYEKELSKREKALKDMLNGSEASGSGEAAGTESPEDYAKTLVYNATGKDSISGASDIVAVMKELKELQSNGMSDQYYKSLLSALKKLGYSTQDLDYDEISDVAQKSKENYERIYRELYRLYSMKGYTDSSASDTAGKQADEIQYEYLYKYSPNIDFFESAVVLAGLDTDSLDGFYQKVKHANESNDLPDIVLGSWIKK